MANLFFTFDGPTTPGTWSGWKCSPATLICPTLAQRSISRKAALRWHGHSFPVHSVQSTRPHFMKFSRSDRGLVGLFSMFGAYQHWCCITSARAQYFERMLEMCGLIDDPECPKARKHRELEAAEIKKAVQRTLTVEIDVLRADTAGKEAKKAFISNSFQNGSSEKTFFEPKTMEASNKTVNLLSFSTVSRATWPSCFLSSHSFWKSLSTLMSSCSTPTLLLLPVLAPLMVSSQKLIKPPCYSFCWLKPPKRCPTQDMLSTSRMVWVLYVLTNLPQTFGDICLQLLDCMVIFSTNCYHADSIKAQERLRRGFSQTYIIDGPATRRFKPFLANEENKRQLCWLLLWVRGSKVAASRLEKCGTAVAIVDGKAYQLDSCNGEVTTHDIHELSSDQEEKDTRVVLYLHYAAMLGYKSAVVRTPDSDIFFILLHHSHSVSLNIYLDIGMGMHRQIINDRAGQVT